MDEPRLLWARLLAAGPADDEALRAALEADPSFRADCLADLRIDGALRGFARAEADAEPFVQGVLDCLRARRDETRFVRKVESALRSRRRARGFLAAGLAAAAALVLLVSSPSPARFEIVEGDAFVGRVRATAGAIVREGQGVETPGEDGRVRIAWTGDARLELGPDTEIAELAASSVRLVRGSLEARSSRPFRVALPSGEVSSVGGHVRLSVTPSGSRVESAEGDAAFRRASDGRAARVPAGQALVAAPAGELAVRPVPIDEIALLPARARMPGGRWRAVRDDQASSGAALELSAPAAGSFVEFSFVAEAQKEYAISVRARSAGGARASLVLEPAEGSFLGRCASWEGAAFHAFAFDARGLDDGYGWVEEGHAFVGRAGREDADRLPDVTESVLRFHRGGPQTLRLYAPDGPVRVDAIRLQATRRTGIEISHKGRGAEKG